MSERESERKYVYVYVKERERESGCASEGVSVLECEIAEPG